MHFIHSVHFVHFIHFIHFVHFVHFLHFIHFIHFIHVKHLIQGKRERSPRLKGKRENGGKTFCNPIPIGNQTVRWHERTHTRHDTKRFPSWTHPATSDQRMAMNIHGNLLISMVSMVSKTSPNSVRDHSVDLVQVEIMSL